MDIFCRDSVGEDGIRGGDGLLRPRRDSEWARIFGYGLDPILEAVLQEELEEDAVELHSYAWHFSFTDTQNKHYSQSTWTGLDSD